MLFPLHSSTPVQGSLAQRFPAHRDRCWPSSASRCSCRPTGQRAEPYRARASAAPSSAPDRWSATPRHPGSRPNVFDRVARWDRSWPDPHTAARHPHACPHPRAHWPWLPRSPALAPPIPGRQSLRTNKYPRSISASHFTSSGNRGKCTPFDAAGRISSDLYSGPKMQSQPACSMF